MKRTPWSMEILVMPITNDAGRNIAGETRPDRDCAKHRREVFTPGAIHLDQVFGEILRDLRTQYLIGFYPKNVPLDQRSFHRIEILSLSLNCGWFPALAIMGRQRHRSR